MKRVSLVIGLALLVMTTGCFKIGSSQATPSATPASTTQALGQVVLPTATTATTPIPPTATAKTVVPPTSTTAATPASTRTATTVTTQVAPSATARTGSAATATTTTATSARTPTVATGGTGDGGTSLDSLIEASKTCKVAKTSYTTAVDFFGVLASSTSDLDITGPDSGKCGFHSKITAADAKFTDASIKALKASGTTDDQIKAQQDAMNKDTQTTVGTEKTCKFKTEDLTAMLTRWKNGQFSTEDWANAECK